MGLAVMLRQLENICVVLTVPDTNRFCIMDKNISFSISLFLVAVVIATVTSFGGDGNTMGDFGEDYFNRKYQVTNL